MESLKFATKVRGGAPDLERAPHLSLPTSTPPTLTPIPFPQHLALVDREGPCEDEGDLGAGCNHLCAWACVICLQCPFLRSTNSTPGILVVIIAGNGASTRKRGQLRLLGGDIIIFVVFNTPYVAPRSPTFPGICSGRVMGEGER